MSGPRASTGRTAADGRWTALRFVLAGGAAALVNFGARILLSRIVDYPTAIVLAYLAGMVTAFVLNRRYVFDAGDGLLARQALRFAIVNVAAVLQTLATSLLLADYLLPQAGVVRHAAEIAHAIGIVVPIVTSYYGHRHWTFR